MSYIVAINPVNLGVTTYSLPWTMLTEHGGSFYGAYATKLQVLGGTIEATATPTVETGDILVADGNVCNVSDMYLQLITDKDIKMTATSSENGVNSSNEYRVETNNEATMKERVDWLGRGAEGAYWRFKFTKYGEEACNFLLLKFDVLVGKIRHRRGATIAR